MDSRGAVRPLRKHQIYANRKFAAAAVAAPQPRENLYPARPAMNHRPFETNESNDSLLSDTDGTQLRSRVGGAHDGRRTVCEL